MSTPTSQPSSAEKTMAARGAYLALADLLAIHVQRRRATLAKPTTSVGKLHAYLVVTRRQRGARFSVEALDAEEVVTVFELAALGVEAPAAALPPWATMTPSAPVVGTTISAVTEWDLFLRLRTEFSDRRPMLPNRIWELPLISTGRPAKSEFNRSAPRSSRGSTL